MIKWLLLAALPWVLAQTCPSQYKFFGDSCYRLGVNGGTYADARAICRSELGRLAALNTAVRLGVPSFLGATKFTYFGLYKSTPCETTGCAGLLLWDACTGCTAPTGGETLNMARYGVIAM